MTPLERSKSRVSAFLKLSSVRLPKYKLTSTLALPLPPRRLLLGSAW